MNIQFNLAWFKRGVRLVLTLTAALVFLALVPPDSIVRADTDAVPQNKVPAAVESAAQSLTNELVRARYQVLRGYFKLYTIDECDVSYAVMRTCFGNNPAAPYVLPVVPPWHGPIGKSEWVDPATRNAVGVTAPGYSISYRLDPREALVILAKMPPPAKYFGIQTYIFTRAGKLYKGSPQYQWIKQYLPYQLSTFFSLVPREPADTPRVQLMANLGDSNNNVVISNQSGSVWNRLRYFIITPNPATGAAVRAALVKIGIPAQDIFTEELPRRLGPETFPPPDRDEAALRFGLDRQADDFATLIRYAMPADEQKANRWRNRLPMAILRVRNFNTDIQTYPWTGMEPRAGTNPPETSYAPDLATLTQAVCDSWNTGSIQDCTQWKTFLNLQRDLLLTGPDCVPARMNCLAPTEDTTYLASPRLPLDPAHFYAVVGALGTATGNATYVGMGLNSSKKQQGIGNLSDAQLAGSANGYSNTVPADKFFVQYFARDCSVVAAHAPAGAAFSCYSIQDTLPYCYDTTDPECDMLALTLRDYILPGTQRAADKDTVLSPKFIRLTIPGQ